METQLSDANNNLLLSMQNRTTMFNPTTGKECKVNNIYGQTAKQCYQEYIDSFGWEPTEFLPEGMTYIQKWAIQHQPTASDIGNRHQGYDC